MRSSSTREFQLYMDKEQIKKIAGQIIDRAASINYSRLHEILQSPIYNFFSMSLTFAATFLLILPVFSEISLSGLRFLAILDRWILAFFTFEMILRLTTGKKKYIRDLFFLDFITIYPLFLEVFLKVSLLSPGEIMEFPGLLLLKGTRVIRLVYFFQFFYLRRQLGMVTSAISSVVKARFFLGISTFVFILIIMVGMLIAFMHHRLTETQKTIRVERIAGHARSYGIANTQQIFEESILSIKQTGPGRNFEIIIKKPDYVKKYYRYNRDFIQIDGATPGSSIQISFKDLNQKQLYVELALLLSGIVVIASILFSLNRYLDTLILEPVDRAIRVAELRIRGEEITDSEIPQKPFTEITILINSIDRLYQKMRAPKMPMKKIPSYSKTAGKKKTVRRLK